MPTSSAKRSRASSISPRSTRLRTSMATRESSETAVTTGRSSAASGAAALDGSPLTSVAVRESPFIGALRFGPAGVYSLPNRDHGLTLPIGREYDPQILCMLLGRHSLNPALEESR